jgi:hypothetical protein
MTRSFPIHRHNSDFIARYDLFPMSIPGKEEA